jgi:hypothetical protein
MTEKDRAAVLAALEGIHAGPVDETDLRRVFADAPDGN